MRLTMGVLHQFFGFRGRISRGTYWLLVVLGVVFGPIGMMCVWWMAPFGNASRDHVVMAAVFIAIVVGICTSGLAIGVNATTALHGRRRLQPRSARRQRRERECDCHRAQRHGARA